MTALIGLVAATLTTLSFVPQVVKTLRSKDTSGLSLAMYTVFSIGVALWVVYGLLIGSLPVIAANVVTLVLCLLIVKVILKRRQ